MNVLIPHNDTLVILAEIQKKFIEKYNKLNADTPLFPHYPLWAFAENILQEANEFTIQNPEFEDNFFYFPAVIRVNTETKKYKIIFAQSNFKIQKAPVFNTKTDAPALPIHQKAFRTGTVQQIPNGWNVFDEKWIKVKP